MKCPYPYAATIIVGTLCAAACDSGGSGRSSQGSPSTPNGQNAGPAGASGADGGPRGSTGATGSTGMTAADGGRTGVPAGDGGAITVPPAASQLDCGPSSSDWPMFGQNICNTAAQSMAGGIDVNTVKNLKPKWTYSA